MSMLSEEKVDGFLSRYVKNGQVIAIGTNTLGEIFLKKLGLLLTQHNWKIELIPTSTEQMQVAQNFHLPITTLNEHEVDVAFEFVDQASEGFDFLKRKSTSLVRDKMIAQSARELIIVLPENDFVPKLNGNAAFEISSFGWRRTLLQLNQIGNVDFSKYQVEPMKTESGHYLVEVTLDEGLGLEDIDSQARLIPGVLETGIFLGQADRMIVVGETQIQVKSRLDFEM